VEALLIALGAILTFAVERTVAWASDTGVVPIGKANGEVGHDTCSVSA
jgi:hypothetical protein